LRADRAAALGLALGALFTAGAARAFPTGSSFDADSVLGAGGDQIHFTGAPAFPTAVCSSCHVNAPRHAQVHLGADDPTLFGTGYVPGQVYLLEVDLLGESMGLDYAGPARCGSVRGQGFVPCDSNGFALESTDVTGGATGLLCPIAPVDGACPSATGATVQLSADGLVAESMGYLPPDGQNPAGYENDGTRWAFYWVAPVEGTGPVTFHVGLVDGNGGQATADVPQDTVGDDVVEAHISVQELGGASYAALGSCRAGRGRPVGRLPLALLGVIIAGALILRARAVHRRSAAKPAREWSRP
jgi:hypothetical protein